MSWIIKKSFKKIKVFDLRNNILIDFFHVAPIETVQFGNGIRQIVSTSQEQGILVGTIANDITHYSEEKGHTDIQIGHGNEVWALDTAENVIVTAGRDGRIVMRDIVTGLTIWLVTVADAINSVVIQPELCNVFAGSISGKIFAFSLEGDTLFEIKVVSQEISVLSFNDSGDVQGVFNFSNLV